MEYNWKENGTKKSQNSARDAAYALVVEGIVKLAPISVRALLRRGMRDIDWMLLISINRSGPTVGPNSVLHNVIVSFPS